MPFYVWECACGAHEETFEHRPEPKAPEHCEKKMERSWHAEARTHTPGSAWPMVTSHITGKPMEIRSEAHLREVCKQYGVRHRPDAAFLEKNYEGVDVRTRKPRYSEGSGRGLPGSWV